MHQSMPMRCESCGRNSAVDAGAALPDRCPACGGALRPARLGKYELQERLGRGGMGEVFKARHPELGTPVAIKVLRLAGAGEGDELRRRFLREARLTARIPHPGVVRVHDFGSGEHCLYLVMEYIEGRTLREVLAEGRLAIERALDLVIQLCDILQAAHESGVIHRDLKPENILLDPRGNLRVLDLGISLLYGEGERITRTGEILGTPEYMAPEQLLEAPEAVGVRADVHAVGVLLYEMLAGRSPFAGANLFQVLKFVEALEPPPPSRWRAGIAAGLDRIVLRALAKDPAERPPSAAALRAELERLRVPAGGARRAVPAAALAIVLLLGLALGLLATAGWGSGGGDGAASSPLEVQPLAPAPAPELAEVLSVEQGVSRREALRELVAAIPEDAPPRRLGQRGIARRALGEFRAAAVDLERADAAGWSGAPRERRVTWLVIHTLEPLLSPRIPWLRARGPEDLKTLFPPLGAGLAPAERSFELGCAALARGEARRAVEHLRAAAALDEGTPDRASLLALAHLAAGEKFQAAQVAAQALARDPGYAPLRLVAARCEPARVFLERLDELVEELDRHGPDRYRLAAIAALERGDLDRLRAAAELEQLCGGGAATMVWYAAARAYLASLASPPLGLAEARARRLLVRLERIDAARYPALGFTRVLLQLDADEPEAAASALASIPKDGLASDPALASLASEAFVAIALARGGSLDERFLAEQLGRALRAGGSFALLRRRCRDDPPAPERRAALRAGLLRAVRAGLAAGLEAERAVGALRLAADLGADLRALAREEGWSALRQPAFLERILAGESSGGR